MRSALNFPCAAHPHLSPAVQNNQRLAGTADIGYGSRVWVVDCDRSCPGELTFDACVDDSDFVAFAAEYDEFFCSGCRADLNHDGFVNDDDCVMFATAYDAFICS